MPTAPRAPWAFDYPPPPSPMTDPADPHFFAAARVPVLTAAEMRAWDEQAINAYAIPERVLMESAGRAAATVVQRLYPTGRVVAVAGSGNNGGDALVAARTLWMWGRDVDVVYVGKGLLDEALLHGWELYPRQAADAFPGAAVLIDGLLGTGASGPPTGAYADAIAAMNAAGSPIVALDGPSGVDLTTGAT